MKKVVENNSDNSCDISDLSSSDISDNESDTGLKIVVNEEKPTKNKKKVTTEELKKVIENSLVSSDDEKPIKYKRKSLPRKQRRLLKKVMIKIKKNQPNQRKIKRKSQPKTLPRKHLWKVMILKSYKEKHKNLVPNILIIPNEKIINM